MTQLLQGLFPSNMKSDKKMSSLSFLVKIYSTKKKQQVNKCLIGEIDFN